MGQKKRRKGGQLRQSTAQQDLYQASSISYARSPRPSVLTNWQWPGRRWKASERLPDGGRVGDHWANGGGGAMGGIPSGEAHQEDQGWVRCCLRTKRLSEESGESGLSSFSAMLLPVCRPAQRGKAAHPRQTPGHPSMQPKASPSTPSLDCTHPGTPQTYRNPSKSIQIHPNPVITNTATMLPQ